MRWTFLFLLMAQLSEALCCPLLQAQSPTTDPLAEPEPRRASVVYDSVVMGCPSALEFRALLRSKLRDDTELHGGPPFNFVVTVQEVEGQFAAVLSRPDGQAVRTLSDPSCTDALDAATTVLALLVEDDLRDRAELAVRTRREQALREQQQREHEPADTELAADADAVAISNTPVDPPQPPSRPFFQAGILAGVGALPVLGVGVDAGVGLLFDSFSTSLSLRYLANPGELNVEGVPVFLHTSGVTGAFAVHWSWLELHALLRAGVLWANARDVSRPGVRELWTLGAGARIQASWSQETWSMFLGVEIVGQFVEVSLMSGSQVLWRSAPVEGLLAVGIRL